MLVLHVWTGVIKRVRTLKLAAFIYPRSLFLLNPTAPEINARLNNSLPMVDF